MNKMATNRDTAEVWLDVAIVAESLSAKIKIANEEFSTVQKLLKDALEENSRLQAAVNLMKKKPCSKCAKLIECTEMLKKKLKEKEDTISVIGKLFLNQNPESYALASQMVNEVITSSSGDNTIFDKSASCTAELDTAIISPESADVAQNPESTRKEISPESPNVAQNPESTKKESPVVAKKFRNCKRKFLSISSMKRNKTSANGEPITSVAESMALDEEDFCDASLSSSVHENPTKILETRDCTPPQTSLASPEILSSTSRCDRSLGVAVAVTENESRETPKSGFRRSRRSLELNFGSGGDDNDICTSPKAKRRTSECEEPKKSAESTDLEIAKAITPLLDPPADGGSKQQKTVWNLKRSRELTNAKFKQTLLWTSAPGKKVDISTSIEYKGGSVPLDAKKSEESKFLCKENIEETFFEPAVTSTHNEYENPAAGPNAAAAAASPAKMALAESTNKPRTPTKIDDSFDCVPSTSPNYKYKRDAIRKKSERMKLPGQECSKCLNFYSARKTEHSNSQMRKLLNKCSRHRDKFPVIVYTPPGLWNPVFDDTDEEVDAK